MVRRFESVFKEQADNSEFSTLTNTLRILLLRESYVYFIRSASQLIFAEVNDESSYWEGVDGITGYPVDLEDRSCNPVKNSCLRHSNVYQGLI